MVNLCKMRAGTTPHAYHMTPVVGHRTTTPQPLGREVADSDVHCAIGTSAGRCLVSPISKKASAYAMPTLRTVAKSTRLGGAHVKTSTGNVNDACRAGVGDGFGTPCQ